MACTVTIRQMLPSVSAALCAAALVLAAACAEPTRTERWVGTYSYPKESPNFPIYFDIAIQGRRVSGRAFDGKLEEASISGEFEGQSYSLLLHPLKQGSSTSQDIHFRGIRSNSSVAGEWEHVVGVKGAWSVEATDLAPNDAMEKYQTPCTPSKSAGKNTTEHPCAKDA